MLPWGHFAVAYLLYSAYARRRFDRPPRTGPTLAIVAGVFFADIVDKTLGWGLDVIPSRSLGHSIVVAVPLIAVVYLVVSHYDRVASATAFAISHVSHLLTDIRPRLLLGYPIRNRYFFWPIVRDRQYTYHERIFDPPWIVEVLVTPLTYRPVFLLLELVLFALAYRRWTMDGRPGLEWVRRRFGVGG